MNSVKFQDTKSMYAGCISSTLTSEKEIKNNLIHNSNENNIIKIIFFIIASKTIK